MSYSLNNNEMDNRKLAGSIPKHRAGAKSDTSHSKHYKSREEALAAFQVAKNKLLNVSKWHDYAGSASADFKLTDRNGNTVTRLAKKGDYFRINIPGPGSEAGNGYDWVEIIAIKEDFEKESDTEFIMLQVHPVPDPKNNDESTAHFFKEDATSTFIVNRKKLIVTAEVHGRNEKPNTNTENIIDKIRNFFVALGASLGFSKIQWKSLAVGLIES